MFENSRSTASLLPGKQLSNDFLNMGKRNVISSKYLNMSIDSSSFVSECLFYSSANFDTKFFNKNYYLKISVTLLKITLQNTFKTLRSETSLKLL